MKRRDVEDAALGVIVLAGSAALLPRLWRRIRCELRGWHQPVRHPLSGWRCFQCGKASADFDGLGFLGGSFVGPLRHTFSRDGAGGHQSHERADRSEGERA